MIGTKSQFIMSAKVSNNAYNSYLRNTYFSIAYAKVSKSKSAPKSKLMPVQ